MRAAEIHTALPSIDLVTIYRNLELFTKEKLIKQFHLTSGEAEYEYQEKPHHHAICNDCNKVLHFEIADEEVKKMLRLKNFSIEDFELTLKGTCKKH